MLGCSAVAVENVYSRGPRLLLLGSRGGASFIGKEKVFPLIFRAWEILDGLALGRFLALFSTNELCHLCVQVGLLGIVRHDMVVVRRGVVGVVLSHSID